MGSILEEHNVRLLGSPDSSASELVVLGHGFGTDQSVWQHIVPHLLDDDYRLLLLDLMGAGSTNPDNFSFARYSSLHGYADDLLAILEEVGAQQCTYVGHSVSGMIGCIAAIARPEAFKKIVLIGASPRYLNDVDYFGGFEQEDLNQLFAAMHSNFRAWVSGFAPLAVGADINCAAVQEFSRTFFCIRPDIALSVSKTIFQSDMRSILPQEWGRCRRSAAAPSSASALTSPSLHPSACRSIHALLPVRHALLRSILPAPGGANYPSSRSPCAALEGCMWSGFSAPCASFHPFLLSLPSHLDDPPILTAISPPPFSLLPPLPPPIPPSPHPPFPLVPPSAPPFHVPTPPFLPSR
ncbi:unnamed protein product [Closterium sp. NIES-64]|nr:unnamed protein product [Closterium sp. NIES-64]